MKILLDTNVLARLAQPGHIQHRAALAAVKTLTERQDALCLVPQNLYELWAISTRPIGETGLGLTVAATRTRFSEMEQAFVILDETPDFRQEWARLVLQHDVKGKSAHDARLVAAMKVHAIPTILTFNTEHFARYTDVLVLAPGMVPARSS
jgi:predicted nucleic acid-binding protein